MSHAEPLAAAASCIDCHTMRNGIVSVHNAGMKPCLRCHDDAKASSACITCHEGTVAAATRARTTSFQKRADPRRVVRRLPQREAGLRLVPRRSDAAHDGVHERCARAELRRSTSGTTAARPVGRCHTASRRPCTRCHSALMGKAHGAGMATSHQRRRLLGLQHVPPAVRTHRHEGLLQGRVPLRGRDRGQPPLTRRPCCAPALRYTPRMTYAAHMLALDARLIQPAPVV